MVAHIPVVPALKRIPRMASLGYIARPSVSKNKHNEIF